MINIVDGEKGIGVITPEGNTVIENKYGEITVELKITAKCEDEYIEKTVSLPNGKFNRETVVPVENWI